MKFNLDFLQKPKSLAIFASVMVLVGLLVAFGWYFINRDSQPAETTQNDPDLSFEKPNSVLDSIYAENDKRAEDNQETIDVSIIFSRDYSQHNSLDDCWLKFDLEVYNVTGWEYPGETPLEEMCGGLDAKQHFIKDRQPKPPRKYFEGRYTEPEELQ